MGKTKKARRKYDRPSCISFLYNIKVYHGWMNTHGLLPLRLLE